MFVFIWFKKKIIQLTHLVTEGNTSSPSNVCSTLCQNATNTHLGITLRGQLISFWKLKLNLFYSISIIPCYQILHKTYQFRRSEISKGITIPLLDQKLQQYLKFVDFDRAFIPTSIVIIQNPYFTRITVSPYLPPKNVQCS